MTAGFFILPPMNTQQKEPVVHAELLAINSIFATIQGEGPFAGEPAIFVRLAGCNLQCPACDTEYTRRNLYAASVILTTVSSLLPRRVSRKKPLVVITGGEPFRQSALRDLVETLLCASYRVQIETNGTIGIADFPYKYITLVCSPKTPKINREILMNADAFKYVLQAGHVAEDGLPSDTMGTSWAVARPAPINPAEIFVQPLDEQNEEKNKLNMQAAVESSMIFGHRLCIQTHKIANLP